MYARRNNNESLKYLYEKGLKIEMKNDFLNSIKIEEDADKLKLLKIQKELEYRGINKNNAYELTKDLTESQKQKLENLYKEQIQNYKISINNYKNKIVSIRKRIDKNS